MDADRSPTLGAVQPSTSSQVWVRPAAAVGAAIVIALIAYFVIKGGGDDSASDKPEAVGAAKLSELAGDTGHPVYWAGRRPSGTYEWTELADGRVYVRYLKPGAPAGDPRARFLTIGTYPVGNAPRALRKADRSPGSRTRNVGGGAIALVNRDTPTSVYLAYPGSPYEIEVFDPDPKKALRLVTSGKIQPVP
jgi:hypothetical protein